MVNTFLKKSFSKSKKILYSRQEDIVSAAFIMMVLVGITKLAGFVKLHLFARFFGASRELDIFWSASALPDLIYGVIIAGSINAALIPVFAKMIRKESGDVSQTESKKTAKRAKTEETAETAKTAKTDKTVKTAKNAKSLDSSKGVENGVNHDKKSGKLSGKSFAGLFSRVINLVILIFLGFGILIFVFAPTIAEFMAGGSLSAVVPGGEGFSEQEIVLMGKLMRIVVISPIILSVSSVFSAAIQANKRFIVPTLAPLFYNLGILFGTVVFAEILNWGIVGVAWGVVLGACMHLLVQLPLGRTLGLEFKPSVINDLWNKNIARILNLALPRILALLGEHINVVINTIISTRLVEGSLSAFKFGSSLYLLPVQLFSNTISQAALPTLSLEFKECDRGAKECRLFVKTFLKSIQQILFLILPTVVFILVLRLPIVRLSLGAGSFDWEDTIITSWVLALFALAILAQSLLGLLIRAFYAMNETVVPLIASAGTLLVSIGGSFFFTNFFSHYYDWRPIVGSLLDRPSGFKSEFWIDLWTWFTTSNSSIAAVGGLPLAIGVASMIEVVILFIILNKRIPIFSWKGFFQPILRKVFATLVMFWVMYILYKFWNFGLDTSTVFSIFSLLAIIGSIGAAVYLGTCIVIEVSEINFFIDLAKKGIKKVKNIFNK